MNLALSRRSALAGASAFVLLAACKNPDGTPMTARQLLQSAVKVARALVKAARFAASAYRSKCARTPASGLCQNAAILAIVTIGEAALPVADDALLAAQAALDDTTSTDEALGNALGILLSAQENIEKLVDTLDADQTSRNLLIEMREIRQQAQFAGYGAA